MTLVLVVILVATFAVFLRAEPVTAESFGMLLACSVAFAFVFGFLVAAACGYMAGLVGSSTSPISGVGIVAIVLVSLLMLALESAGGLLGTQEGVQMAIALAIFTTSVLSAPQATLMLAIARGIFTHQLNWAMILIGMAVGLGLIAVDQILKRTCQVARMPVLAVGIGIYLPPTVSAPLVVGALLAWLLERALRRRARRAGQPYEAHAELPGRRGTWLGLAVFAGVAVLFYRRTLAAAPRP